jgi:hypothetical protein
MTGTAIRKTDPHQKDPSSRPPITGPSTIPAISDVPHTPMAAPICFGSRNIPRSSARTDGTSVAPAIPSSARAPISMPGETEYAARTEAARNSTAPPSSTVRRPIRSPRPPAVMRNPAMRNP